MPDFPVGHLVTADEFNTICPVGVCLPYAGATVPNAWLACDGASYLRADYPDLFDALGGASSQWGLPDGTHFNVPDFRGRMAVGYAASGGHTDVSTLGNNDGAALANRRPKHRHTVTDPGHSHTLNEQDDLNAYQVTGAGHGLDAGTGRSSNSATTGISVGASGSDPLDAPAYLVLNYIIKT